MKAGIGYVPIQVNILELDVKQYTINKNKDTKYKIWQRINLLRRGLMLEDFVGPIWSRIYIPTDMSQK